LTDLAPADERFELLRPRLHGIAYRMTGSVADAEDVCQDVWLRWRDVDHATVANDEAYCVTLTTRLAIDRLKSARHKRETYVGPYLPEPVVSALGSRSTPPAPDEVAELADSLTFGFLVLLDELSPVERAVFLLHDVFRYPFDEIADAVDKSVAAVRKIASRARTKLDEHRVARRRVDEVEAREKLERMSAALVAGDIDGVMAMLAPDVVQLDDGGPERRAARKPIVGPDRVARLMVNLAARIVPASEIEYVDVNGNPGAMIRVDGRPELVLSVEFAADGLIRRIFVQVNPTKLSHLS
jgi:RNA polymerase sigma-70 factor (ECF subfamily)